VFCRKKGRGSPEAAKRGEVLRDIRINVRSSSIESARGNEGSPPIGPRGQKGKKNQVWATSFQTQQKSWNPANAGGKKVTHSGRGVIFLTLWDNGESGRRPSPKEKKKEKHSGGGGLLRESRVRDIKRNKRQKPSSEKKGGNLSLMGKRKKE